MTEVVLSFVPNPKRAGAAKRYALYYAGATQDDLLALGMQKGDIAWDIKQSFVTWGPGERVEPPHAPLPAVEPAAPRTRTTTRAVVEPDEEASVPDSKPWAPGVDRRIPPAGFEVEGQGGQLAPWYKGVTRVTAHTGLLDQSLTNAPRPWTLRATLPDGRVMVRVVAGDITAATLSMTTSLHGLDSDEWREEAA